MRTGLTAGTDSSGSTSRCERILAVGASQGGVADLFRRVLTQLRARGHEVEQLLVPLRGPAAWAGLTAAVRERRTLRAAPTIHLEFGSNDVEVFWFALAAVLMRRDCVVVAHDYPKLIHRPGSGLSGHNTRLGRALAYRLLSPALDRIVKRTLIRRAGVLVVFGPEARQGWTDLGGRQVMEITHGSDGPRDDGLPPSRGESVLFAGFVGPSKGVDNLLMAWRRVGAEAALPLVIAGSGHGPWFHDALERCGDYPSPPRVLGAIGEESEFQALIERAAVVVLPYRSSSPASGVLVRALAAGRPVIATPVPAMRVIRDWENGVLVPVDDPEALAQAILRLCHSPQVRDRLGAAALQTAREEFSWDKHMTGLEAAYEAAGRSETTGTSMQPPVSR